MALPPILLEDDSLAVFDKPAGLPVAAGREDKPGGTMMDAVRAARGRGIAAVHRLDAEASGVVLCAKSKPALDFLSGEFQAKKVGRKFLALVLVRAPGPGLAPEFAIDAALETDPARPDRKQISDGGGGA